MKKGILKYGFLFACFVICFTLISTTFSCDNNKDNKDNSKTENKKVEEKTTIKYELLKNGEPYGIYVIKSNKGDSLSEHCNDLYEYFTENAIKTQCEFINSLAEKNSSAEFYVYNIEMDRTIEPFDKKNTHYIYNLEKKYYSKKVTYGSFLLNSYEDFLKYNYKSDHHWNEEGKKKGYLELCKLLGVKGNPIKTKGKYNSNLYFVGSRLSGITDTALNEKLLPIYSDKFAPYIYKYPNLVIDSKHVYDYEGPGTIYNSRYFIKETNGKTYIKDLEHQWSMVESGTRINNSKAEEGNNLLIFGYSHARPQAYLLASHFRNTYFFQPRDTGSINLSEFIAEKKITKVLFLTPNTYMYYNKILNDNKNISSFEMEYIK